ncbi:MAG: 5-oxoprolinase subunit PxpA [Gammaproteobacteria bacterium]
MTIDINCDMGEAYSIYRCGDDEGIMPFITSANVACGFHASDPVVMHRTVKLAKQHGVRVGAHPSFPDRDGFGRRVMKMEREELRDTIIYQVAALKGFLDIEGMPLNHIKPHGALYGAAWTDEDVAIACAEAAQAFGVPMYGTTGTLHETIWPKYTEVKWEIFADLDYDDEGRCIITRHHTSVAPEKAVAQIMRVVTDGTIRSVNGKDVPTRVDTICVHSDTPDSVAVAKAVREAVAPYLA